MSQTKQASLVEIKKYFGYNEMAVFNSDWKACNDKDKSEIKDLVGTEIESGRFQVPA